MTRGTQIAPDEVTATFDEVAAAYDRQVDLNPGYHANLRRAARRLLQRMRENRSGTAGLATGLLLDVGCGSGASTRALALETYRPGEPCRIVGVDGSAGMLAAARAKSWPEGVSFVHAQADELAEKLAAQHSDPAPDAGSGPVDGILAAYLVRNVGDKDAVLRDLADLLAPGGVLAVHEYSVRGNPIATAVWTAMCWSVVIPLGWLTARHTRLYRYLWRSVLEFDSVEQLGRRLEAAGLRDVEVLPATGWHRGILHTVLATKPPATEPLAPQTGSARDSRPL